MTSTVLSPGDSIRATCTKCRKPTRHLVVSIVDGAAARVECTVCEGVHNFRSPAEQAPARERTAAGSRRKALRSASSSTVLQEWERLTGGKDPSQATPYRPTGVPVPRQGDLLHHPAFGVGAVRKPIPPNKAEVLFRDGLKRLVFGP